MHGIDSESKVLSKEGVKKRKNAKMESVQTKVCSKDVQYLYNIRKNGGEQRVKECKGV